MEVKITVNNIWSRISGLKDIKIVDYLDKITSYYVEGYQFTKAFQNGIYNRDSKSLVYWDGKKHLLTKNLVFPTGLLDRISIFLKRKNIDFTVIDKRKDIKNGEIIPIKKFTPREYQIKAVELAKKFGRGMIKIATGGGKTLVASMLVSEYNIPSVIYVVGKDLLYQFHKSMQESLGIDIGIVGDGNCDIRKINVVSVWTAINSFGMNTKVSLDEEDWAPEVLSIDSEQKESIKDMIEKSNLSIFDEAHFLATDTLQSIYKASKNCRYFFGLTATPIRDDNADILLEAVCGRKIYNLPASKLIEENYLVQPKIILFEVPRLMEPLFNYSSIYRKYITENEIRNNMIKDIAIKLINKGRRILILVKHINHGKELEKKLSNIPLFFVNGEVDSQTRNVVKKSFEDGELKCIIASQVYDLGIDIPVLDGLILAGGGKSTVRALQRIGRVIRTSEGKKDALVIDFIDNARYLYNHSATRIAVYESEKGFKIKFPKNFNSNKLKRPNKIKEKLASNN